MAKERTMLRRRLQDIPLQYRVLKVLGWHGFIREPELYIYDYNIMCNYYINTVIS